MPSAIPCEVRKNRRWLGLLATSVLVLACRDHDVSLLLDAGTSSAPTRGRPDNTRPPSSMLPSEVPTEPPAAGSQGSPSTPLHGVPSEPNGSSAADGSENTPPTDAAGN